MDNLKRMIQLLHNSSARLLKVVDMQTNEVLWQAFMRKEARMHFGLAIRVLWMLHKPSLHRRRRLEVSAIISDEGGEAGMEKEPQKTEKATPWEGWRPTGSKKKYNPDDPHFNPMHPPADTPKEVLEAFWGCDEEEDEEGSGRERKTDT